MTLRPPTIDYRPRDARTSRGWRHDVLAASGTLWAIGMIVSLLAIAAIIVGRILP